MFTLVLIGSISLVSILAFKNQELQSKLMFNAYSIKHNSQFYRFWTHIFVHANWAHLIFNMLTLFFFGSVVENYYAFIFKELGDFVFLVEFLLASVVSSIASFIKNKNNIYYNAVGASGAVSAILYSSILLSPLNKIYIMFIPIGIPAYIFGVFYLVYSASMSKRNSDNIGHDAHFWGAVFGFCFPLLINYKLFLSFINIIISSFR